MNHLQVEPEYALDEYDDRADQPEEGPASLIRKRKSTSRIFIISFQFIFNAYVTVCFNPICITRFVSPLYTYGYIDLWIYGFSFVVILRSDFLFDI